MVSLKNFTSEMSEQEYHAHSAWSYSQIARYAREGFSAITNIHNPITATAAMEFGSLLDAMLTQPEKVNDMYAVLETTQNKDHHAQKNHPHADHAGVLVLAAEGVDGEEHQHSAEETQYE